MVKYRFGHITTLNLLTGKNAKNNELFVAGMFIVKEKTRAEVYAGWILKTGEVYKDYRRASSLRALLKVFSLDGFVFDTFISRMGYKQSKAKLIGFIRSDDCFRILVSIYNSKTSDDKKLLVAL
jgi:hypothetical protein